MDMGRGSKKPEIGKGGKHVKPFDGVSEAMKAVLWHHHPQRYENKRGTEKRWKK